MELTKELAVEIYRMGVDHGQLMMEDERDSEDWSNAVRGLLFDNKFCMPLPIEVRRKPHSETWRKAKRASFDRFVEVLAQIKL